MPIESKYTTYVKERFSLQIRRVFSFIEDNVRIMIRYQLLLSSLLICLHLDKKLLHTTTFPLKDQTVSFYIIATLLTNTGNCPLKNPSEDIFQLVYDCVII